MLRRLAAALAVAATALIASPAHAATTAPPAAVAAFHVSAVSGSMHQSLMSRLAAIAPSGYVVHSGDTLGRIASRYCGTTAAYRSIGAANGIANYDLIYPGEKLRIVCTGGKPAPRAAPRQAAATAVLAATGSTSGAVSYAMRQIGKPYVFGAVGPNGFDCSGLVVASFRSVGISLPHFTGALLGRGTPVSRANLRPGDLVFLSSSHVGLAIGGDKVVVAPQSGESVKVQTIYAFYAGRRL